LFLVASVANGNVCDVPAESLNDPLEAAFFADLRRAVNVLDLEDLPQTVEKNLGQGWNQLGRCGQHIDAVGSGL